MKSAVSLTTKFEWSYNGNFSIFPYEVKLSSLTLGVVSNKDGQSKMDSQGIVIVLSPFLIYISDTMGCLNK